MSSHGKPSSPLVWVTIGKTQHPAKLVKSTPEESVVEWACSGELETVKSASIEHELSPRRSRPSPQRLIHSLSPSKRRKKESPPGDKPSSSHWNSPIELDTTLAVPDNDDGGSESEVEFLFTLPADSSSKTEMVTEDSGASAELSHHERKPPACAVVDISVGERHSDSGSRADADERKLSQTIIKNCTRTDAVTAELQPKLMEGQNEAENPQEDPEMEAKKPSPNTNNNEQRQYTYASSAYVQNLAEICHTILYDARWRVSTDQKQQQGLFQWETGDDLSIVTDLSRYWQGRKQEAPSGEDATARALNLYCRLFYRKGPWFRIDDVYNRYYAPRKKSSIDESSESEENTGPTSQNLTRSRSHGETSDDKASNKCTMDENELEEHKKCLSELFLDLHELEHSGRIRSFVDERECGETVGRSLLQAEERKVVLNKLGARRNAATSHENAILKQMKQQQCIFSHFRPNSGGMLPVRKHVDQVMLQKLAQRVVQSCCSSDYVPAVTMRTYSEQIKNHIYQISRDMPCKSPNCSRKSQLKTCFRLRESPLRTLLRCTRLYLCATSGPGSMRNDGSGAWRSLEPARANQHPPLAKLISPPNIASWHKVDYPGLMVRFGRSSAPFSKAYALLSVADCKPGFDLEAVKVFYSMQSFRAWELAVELRANVDYLVELHERMRYDQRRRDRDDEKRSSISSQSDKDCESSVDFLNLLENEGRERILKTLLDACGMGPPQLDTLQPRLSSDIDECLATLESECERTMGCLGALILHVLLLRHKSISTAELDRMKRRPWLRHLFWDGCIGYILWDIIPYFEKNGLYRLAIQSLQVLVYGNIDGQLVAPALLSATTLAPLLLSRRARGKALERIVIDYIHLQRAVRKGDEENAKGSTKETNLAKQLKAKQLAEQQASFCEKIIRAAAPSGSISFAAIRCLARRLKKPLSQTLSGIFCLEVRELGLRLENSETSTASDEPKDSKSKYSDWTPITDRSTANALVSDGKENGMVGGRCAFVGFEDDGVSNPANPVSLNVEELAMDFYRSGRLPAEGNATGTGGGWNGWHDEGGKLRALFRIICCGEVLGMDWGPPKDKKDASFYTIHLSPYQGAPFDLHVGYELTFGPRESSAATPTNGFYYRRQDKINTLLDRVTKCNGQEISDLVYSAIASRFKFAKANGLKDPNLLIDLLQLRTLSAVAAGCGGELLAAAFRCLFFDYRHFSGGLPDLFLLRAVYADTNSTATLVELGEWIGESFSEEHRQDVAMQRAMSMLSDRDDDFLGCSKVGDSGGRTANRSRGRKSQATATELDSLPEEMPARLVLSHQERPVKPECMLVEVKSSNDRLDPRQEDWLNVLDRYGGNARVCKFESSKDSAGNGRKSLSRKPAPATD